MDDDKLDNTIQRIEDYYFGEGEERGEKLFLEFAKKHRDQFLQAKLSSSTENKFE